MEECTFRPRTNKVQSHMGSARLYLESNVIDRLTRHTAASATFPSPNYRYQVRVTLGVRVRVEARPQVEVGWLRSLPHLSHTSSEPSPRMQPRSDPSFLT